jgi:hypothetical protein
MIDNPYETIRQEIKRKFTFNEEDVFKPLSKKNPFKPDKIKKYINERIQIKIEDIRDEELTDKEICLGCVSEVFQNVLTATESEVPRLKKKCLLKRYSTIENLFKEPDSTRAPFHSKTKDVFAIYCGYLGWNDLDINNDFTHKERKETPELESKNYFKKLEHLIESLEKYKSEVEKNTPNQNTDVVLKEIQKLKSDFQNEKKDLKSSLDSLISKNDLQEATERIEKIFDDTLKNLPINNQNYTTYNTQINIAIKDLKIFLETIINEKKTREKENKETLPFVKTPNVFIAFFEKILINGFNRKNRFFKGNNEIVPIGFNSTELKTKTENYIDTNYQNGIIYNPQDETLNQEEALKTLFKKIFKNDKSVIRDTKWIFVLAGSGIGKTSLLIRLYLEANKFGAFKNRVYFLPFSQRHRIKFLNKNEKSDSILFLDAFDEDFSISKISQLTIADITYLRSLTQSFEKVILTSRSQFFEDKFKIDDYIKNLGTETDFKYETFVLCPFNQEQIDKYIKRKFKGDKVKIEKAHRVIKYIGKDTNRQLLISQIDMLIDLLDKENIPTEVKEYYIFDTMLTNWLEGVEKTKIKDSNLKNKESRLKAFEKENTYAFCRILAKYFYVIERDFYIGFSLKELKEELDKNKVEHSSLKINRTFLVLTKGGNYRFAHRSIYEFFLAQTAVEDEAFDNESFHSYKKENDFASKMYEQCILKRIYDVKKSPLAKYIHFTNNLADIEQYQKDCRFAPYFIINNIKGKEVQRGYFERHWKSFESVKILDYKKIIGIKFISKQSKINKEDYYNLISPIIRFLQNLRCFDLSNLDLDSLGYTSFKNLAIHNYLNSNVQIRYRNIPLKESNKRALNYLNLRGTRNKYLKVFNKYYTVSLNYNLSLFNFYKDNLVPKRLNIFLSHEDLEKGREYLLDVDRIRVLSKTRGFKCVFFTEDKILSEEEILRCFPDVHKTKFTTTNIEYFKKAGNYVDYIDNGISLKQGVCEAFEKTVFSQYPNSFPKLEKEELELEVNDKSTFQFLDRSLKIKSVKTFIPYIDLNLKEDLEFCSIMNTNSLKGFNYHIHKDAKAISFEKFLDSLDKKYLSKYDFRNLKHLIINNFDNVDFINKLNVPNIESLYLLSIEGEFLFNHFDFKQIKRLGLSFKSKKIKLDFSQLFFDNIQEVTIINERRDIIIKNDKAEIELKNIDKIFYIKSLKILNLDFYTKDQIIYVKDSKINNRKTINSNIEKLVISQSMFLKIKKDCVVFDNLKYLKITNVFIENGFSNNFIHELIDILEFKTITHLVLNINYPEDEESLLLLKNLISNIEKYNISSVEMIFANYNIIEDKNHNYSSIEKLLSYLKPLATSSNLLLGFSLFRNGFDSFYSQQVLYLSLSHLVNKNELLINFKRVFKNRVSLTFHKLPTAVFDTLYKSLNKEYSIKKILINNIEYDFIFFKKRTLAFFSPSSSIKSIGEKLSLHDSRKITFLNDNFLNSNKETIVSSDNFLLDYLSYNHIRFINLEISKFFFNHYHALFTNTKKVSFSSFKNIDLYMLKSSFLKEIELLTFYTPEEEKEKISEYKKQFEELGINFTVNPKELKVINADKGIFETQVIEE